MSTKLYDDALVAKLRGWTQNTKIHVYGPDDARQLFETIADEQGDTPIKLPIISLTRGGGYEIQNINKRPVSYDGFTQRATEDKSLQINMIPISIPYQLDVYTRYYAEADAFMRDLVFNFINHPTFEVVMPYNNAQTKHTANVRINTQVENNSNIPERMVVGQFTRLTLQLVVDDAYLWDTRIRGNFQIDKALVDTIDQ